MQWNHTFWDSYKQKVHLTLTGLGDRGEYTQSSGPLKLFSDTDELRPSNWLTDDDAAAAAAAALACIANLIACSARISLPKHFSI